MVKEGKGTEAKLKSKKDMIKYEEKGNNYKK